MYVLICLAIVLAIASIMDFRFRRIPNWLTFPAMTAGLIYHLYASGSKGLLFSIEGLLLGFVLLTVWRAPPLVVVIISAVAGIALA